MPQAKLWIVEKQSITDKENNLMNLLKTIDELNILVNLIILVEIIESLKYYLIVTY